jgi:hypothetical protein
VSFAMFPSIDFTSMLAEVPPLTTLRGIHCGVYDHVVVNAPPTPLVSTVRHDTRIHRAKTVTYKPENRANTRAAPSWTAQRAQTPRCRGPRAGWEAAAKVNMTSSALLFTYFKMWLLKPKRWTCGSGPLLDWELHLTLSAATARAGAIPLLPLALTSHNLHAR